MRDTTNGTNGTLDTDFILVYGRNVNAQRKQIKASNAPLKLLFLVFECPGRQVKSALITNVRDSIKREESKWSRWTND